MPATAKRQGRPLSVDTRIADARIAGVLALETLQRQRHAFDNQITAVVNGFEKLAQRFQSKGRLEIDGAIAEVRDAIALLDEVTV